ncbi:MAG: GyrI-like domain-containing protein [Candidatus Babeliales bacterium]|jgi:predicted transcriptional regulator YdeE
MQYKIVQSNRILFAGIELRLNLTDEQAPQKIGNFWNKFFTEKILDKIVNAKKPINTMALYTNYDNQGNYSMVIGCQATSRSNIPSDMTSEINVYEIPAAKYAVFSVTGQFPQAVSDFWQKLWLNKDNLGFQRAFTTDFELYDHRFSSATPEMDVYTAIK